MTEIADRLSQIIAEHGQHQFELALAGWYFEAARVSDYYKDLEKAEEEYSKADALFGGHFDYRALADKEEGIRLCLRLGSVMLRRHRHAEAKLWYRKAMSLKPNDIVLGEEVGHVLLRHGSDREIRDFFDRLIHEQRESALAQYGPRIYDLYPEFIRHIKSALVRSRRRNPGRPLAAIVLPIWGERYINMFLRHTLPVLMSSNNLPRIAVAYQTTLVVVGSRQAIESLRSEKLFKSLCQTVLFQPIILDEVLMSYSDQLAQYLLLSLAHYSTLEAARQADATVFFAFPDNIINDGFYASACERLSEGASSVACAGFRLDMRVVLPDLAKCWHSNKDGSVSLHSRAIVRLLMRHLGDEWFVTSKRFAFSPFFLCWRVGDEGLFVRATHLQPYAIRANLLNKPLTLKIDPIDAQFMWRHFGDLAGIHCASGTEMCCFDAGISPNLDAPRPDVAAENVFRDFDFARFLQVYDTPLHRRFLKSPVRLSLGQASKKWEDIDSESADMVDRVLAMIDAMDGNALPRPAWAIEEERDFMTHG